MPSVRIPPGVVRGDSRASVPGRWNTTSLVRWQENNMVPVGGWERVNPAPLLSVPRSAHVWLDTSFNRYSAFLCDAHAYVQDESNFRNITPADFADANASQKSRGFGSGAYSVANYGSDEEPRIEIGQSAPDPDTPTARERYAFPVSFSLDNWGEELLFGSSADGRVWVWAPDTPSNSPYPCPNAPVLMQAFLTTEEHSLMVLGGDGFPNRVAWSDQNNREGWDYTRVEGQAGFNDLDGAGTILTARRVPGGILIFTVTSVWLCTYIGAPNYYGFKKLSEHVAPISPQAVTVAAGKCFWLSRRNLWKYEGGIVTPLPSTLGIEAFEEIDQYNAPRRVCSGFNSTYPEIWWFYPSKGQNENPENDRYIIYNFVDGWWADGNLKRSFFTSSPIDGRPLAGDPAGLVYQHEIGYLAQGQARTGLVFAQVGSLSFDDGDSEFSVTRAQVDGRRSAATPPNSVKLTFRGSRARGGNDVALGAFPVRPDGWMDCRFTAKDFYFTVEGTVDAPWSLGAINFTVQPRGKR